MPRIGELLVAEGVLSNIAVQSALGFQRHTGEPFRLGTILLDRDLLAEEKLLKALSVIHRCDYVTWSDILKAPSQVVRLLPERAALRLAAVPYALEGRGVRVAFKNPSNLAAVDEVSAVTGRPVIPAVISEVRLLQAFHLFYGRPIPSEFRSVLHHLERNEERRLTKTRTRSKEEGLLGGRFVNAPTVPAAREKARKIPIAPGPPPTLETPSLEAPPRPPREAPALEAPPREAPLEAPPPDTPRPVSYSAPFGAAEVPHNELVEGLDFLPDFAPPRALTADDLAARMWKVEPVAPEKEDTGVRSMWHRRNEVAPQTEEASPARNRLAEGTLETLAVEFPRVLLFMSGQEGIQGWTGRGGGLSSDRIARLRIPWGEPSIFAFVKLSGAAHRGPLSPVLVPPAMADLLGPKAGADCAVFPVRIKDRLVAFVYADRLGAPLSEDDYRSLDVASSSLGSSLARLLLELRKAVPS